MQELMDIDKGEVKKNQQIDIHVKHGKKTFLFCLCGAIADLPNGYKYKANENLKEVFLSFFQFGQLNITKSIFLKLVLNFKFEFIAN